MGNPQKFIRQLEQRQFSPFELLDKDSVIEKVLALTLAAPGRLGVEASFFEPLLADFASFSTNDVPAVVFGGGSGLSSIVGGNNRVPTWAEHPFEGLKSAFDDLTVSVCTTDDGGSTGLILRELEMIALGDLRQVCLSMVRSELLYARYGLDTEARLSVVGALRDLINHRFTDETREECDAILRDPRRLLTSMQVASFPAPLARYFDELSRILTRDESLASLERTGQCAGNLYLLAAIRRHTGDTGRFGPRATIEGVRSFADHIGAEGSKIFPATTTPGQLRFLYANGVTVYGQGRALRSRRGYPVERVCADYLRPPRVDARLLRAIERAELILFAPGSIYSSLIPILQIEPITEAIRANKRAVKILAANFWIQEGETDITRRGPRARYTVSDMIEAYHRNVAGGVQGLFQQILVADMKQLPGHVLRNYALEGKLPIFLDRTRVRALGYEPVEAPIFSRSVLEKDRMLHHDPERFAVAVRTLFYLRRLLTKPARPVPWEESVLTRSGRRRRASPASYMRTMRDRVGRLDLQPESLARVLETLLWENRDILPEHIDQFAGIRVVSVSRWKRSTEWDKVLGYFDPEDGFVKLHASLLKGDPSRLHEDILIGIGEALLGRYVLEKGIEPLRVDGEAAGQVYRIRLAKPRDRGCFLTDSELRTYLELVKMVQSEADPDVYRIVVNGDQGFMPPGLQFGLLYAWYLNNAYGGLADYEMSLVRWPMRDLVPLQTQTMVARRRLVRFFRDVVFRHFDPATDEILRRTGYESRVL